MFKNLAGACVVSLAAMIAAFAADPSTAQASAQTHTPLKVGFVYVSPIGEAGWTYQHDQGRLAMERALGDQVRTTVVEAVPEGADSERVIRDLAVQGHQLIFATSFGYLEATLRVAAEFPNVKFEHAGGYKTAANVNTYNARYYEARYLAGLLAGHSSKSGVAGYVAGFPVPEVVQGINAFTLGMRAASPRAQVRVLWLNSWFDPSREREAALTLINQGADVLTNHSGSPAVPQTAQANFKDKGVRVVSFARLPIASAARRRRSPAAPAHSAGPRRRTAAHARRGNVGATRGHPPARARGRRRPAASARIADALGA